VMHSFDLQQKYIFEIVNFNLMLIFTKNIIV
jgi:hypothetical protein